MKSRLLSLLAIPAIALTVGCAGLSNQSYGSHTRGHTVSEGASLADVLVNMGEPDSIYRSEDTQMFVYRGLKGSNFFGIHSKVKREDLIVVMDQGGRVLTVVPVEVGRGSTIGSPAIYDGTHPVPPSELFSGANNYGYVYEGGGR